MRGNILCNYTMQPGSVKAGATRRTFLSGSFCVTSGALLRAAAVQPNILLILMDDLGYSALSCYGNKLVPTPNLDRLSRDGVRFTDAYVTPQCTPTRATLMTGQYTARNKMWHVIPAYRYPNGRVQEVPYRESLSRDAFTLAKGLKKAGYATACIGKWHLTANDDGNYSGLRPETSAHYGFDVVATPSTIEKEFSTGDKAVNRFTDEAIEFIRGRRSRPWFCYLAHHSIHNVVSAPGDLVKKYREKGFPSEGLNNATYLAAIEHFDKAVGRLVEAVDNLGLAESTLVLFVSDNGGIFRTWQPNPSAVDPGETVRLSERPGALSNAPLRDGKGSAYEGGIRIPMIARWKGSIRPGQICRTPVHIVDLMPTFLAMARSHSPVGYQMDGVSLLPLLNGSRIDARPLFWYQPFYDVRWLATPSAVIREGDFKLIEFFGDYLEEKADAAEYVPAGRIELYDLRKDIGETRNLAEQMPEKAAAMRQKLHSWIKSTGSPIPGINPEYRPQQPFVETRGMPPPLG